MALSISRFHFICQSELSNLSLLRRVQCFFQLTIGFLKKTYYVFDLSFINFYLEIDFDPIELILTLSIAKKKELIHRMLLILIALKIKYICCLKYVIFHMNLLTFYGVI